MSYLVKKNTSNQTKAEGRGNTKAYAINTDLI